MNPPKKWTDEEIERLKYLWYDEDKTVNEISIILNKSFSSVKGFIGYHKLYKNNNRIWEEYEIKILKELYPQNIERIQILSQLNNKIWEQVKWKASSLNIHREIFKEYNVIGNYFKNIININQAYLLGLIAADGGLSNNGSQITLALHSKDITLLELFKEQVVPDYNIKTNDKNISSISISNKELCNDLLQYGIGPQKTLTLQWPTNLAEEFEMIFILGYFDGDGCLGWEADNRPGYITYKGCWGWTLLGQPEFLNATKEKIYNHTNIEIKNPIKMGKCNVYTIQKSGKKAEELDSYMSHFDIGLKRKRIQYFWDYHEKPF